MKKMPCLFVREFEGRRIVKVTEVVTPGCEWALSGEHRASRKRDGTACMIRQGRLYARYDAKAGKAPPLGAIPCDPGPDPVTGHWPHWVEVFEQPQFVWHREAWKTTADRHRDGTYELCGPKVGGNAERFPTHRLIRHGDEALAITGSPFALAWVRTFLDVFPFEGVVFQRVVDGLPIDERCKIRRADFGFAWPIPLEVHGGT